MHSVKILSLSLLILFFSTIAFSQPSNDVYIELVQLNNLNKQSNTRKFDDQMEIISSWLEYGFSFDKNIKTPNFSKAYQLDSLLLKSGIKKINKTIPKTFWTQTRYEEHFDTKQNEDSIWSAILVVQNRNKKRNLLSAIKITFEGNMSNINLQAKNPLINNIEFILDQPTLNDLEKKLLISSIR